MPGRNKIMPPPEEGKVLSATLALPIGQRRPIKPRPPPAKALLSLKVALRPSLSVCSPKSKTRVEIGFFNYLSIKSSDEPTIKGDGLARRVSSTHSNAPVTRLEVGCAGESAAVRLECREHRSTMKRKKISKPTNHLRHHSTFEFVYTAHGRYLRAWSVSAKQRACPIEGDGDRLATVV